MIEIKGVDFINKGAELMLYAIVYRLKKMLNNCDMVLVPRIPFYKNQAELGLYQKIWVYRYNIQWGYFAGIIPSKIRKLYGLVTDSEISAVLDASGFGYSDQWGDANIILSAKAIKKWKRQKTKIILLPQAFGPFTSLKSKEAMKIIIENADLIYARDVISYEHILNLSGERSYIKMAPDFTNLVEGILPGNFNVEKHRFCVIINMRMVDKSPQDVSSNYISFMVKCIDYLNKRQCSPFILCHEGVRDKELAKEIVAQTHRCIDIVDENNPIHIKGIIGACKGLISCRFHGLVSGLSQGVPALGAGWSHKYEKLFEDYLFPQGLLSVVASDKEIRETIDLVIDEESNAIIRKQLIDTSNKQKGLTNLMWDEVLTYLRQS
jgi:colanic acid/amylovoran biosynthesis protein